MGLVNYGVGNHTSISHCLNRGGFRCLISDAKTDLETCDLLILPGVGAFNPAMEALRTSGLSEYLASYALANKPLIGICLGMQLLGKSSVEFGFSEGLSVFPGKICPLGPHTGWNTLKSKRDKMFFGLEFKEHVYFNHSYVYENMDEYVIGETEFRKQKFPSLIKKGRVVGFQFHPEKSQIEGRRVLVSTIKSLCDA